MLNPQSFLLPIRIQRFATQLTVPTIKTQFMLNKARVQMELPSRGFVWLFINPTVTISQFKDICMAEDPKIASVEIQDGNKALAPETNLLQLL